MGDSGMKAIGIKCLSKQRVIPVHTLKTAKCSLRPEQHLQIPVRVLSPVLRRHRRHFPFYLFPGILGKEIPCVLIAEIIQHEIPALTLLEEIMADRGQVDLVKAALTPLPLGGEERRVL